MDVKYGWLVFSLILLAAWLFVFIVRRDLRREMLIISFLFLGMGVAGHPYFNHYWTPTHLVQLFSLNIGFEDFIYMFAISGLGAVSYEFFFQKVHKKNKRRNLDLSKTQALLAWVAGSMLFLAADALTPWNLIITAGIGLTAVGLALIYFKPELAKPLVLNALSFALLVVILEFVTELVVPGFSGLWNPQATIGINILNFPIEEFLFHFGWGMAVGSLFEASTGQKTT